MSTEDAAAPFPLDKGKGAAVCHTTIIAETCNDGGVQIACIACGHVFVGSNPFTDQSHAVDNLQLARALWFHDCLKEGLRWRGRERRGRKPIL